MHRFTFVRLALLGVALLALAQSASAQTQAGAIKAVRVTGEVTKVTVDGSRTPIVEGQSLIETDVVDTGADSGVVLVFMNGSSIKLAENSRLAVEEFKMDPLGEDIAVAGLAGEPTVSKTRLNLAYGEMVGSVKKLNTTSRFDIKTPVGAAGIRGTTFRIVLRFQADGQVQFQLSTSEGRVVFSGVVPAGEGSTPTDTTATEVEVAAGQEVSAVVQVNPTTNTVTSVQVSSAQPISAEATQAINTAVTQAIQQAVQSTSFTPTEQSNAAAQTPVTTSPPSQPSSQQTTQEQPGVSSPPKTTPPPAPVITPPTILDTSVRSGSG
ncbi:MAG: FecR domain-containing protein [Candidatus Didemnitutus sp.]|nr:FecR domain-containing protein [Candidatus Didemnitutus sp.]